MRCQDSPAARAVATSPRVSSSILRRSYRMRCKATKGGIAASGVGVRPASNWSATSSAHAGQRLEIGVVGHLNILAFPDVPGRADIA